MGISGSKTKERIESDSKRSASSNTNFDIFIFPVIFYDLTDRLSILATCDFISLGFNRSILKEKDPDRKQTSNNFGFNAQSSIFSSLPGIRAGFSYKF